MKCTSGSDSHGSYQITLPSGFIAGSCSDCSTLNGLVVVLPFLNIDPITSACTYKTIIYPGDCAFTIILSIFGSVVYLSVQPSYPDSAFYGWENSSWDGNCDYITLAGSSTSGFNFGCNGAGYTPGAATAVGL